MLKKMMKKISSGITAALMCLSMVSALPAAVINVSAEGTNMDLGAPAHEKTLTSNGDGTYNLSLSVKGESKASSEKTKADVVIIFDRSGSMKEAATTKEKCGPRGCWDETISTRLEEAQQATNSLVSKLLGRNDDSVRVALVSFSTNAKKDLDYTSDLNSITSKVNSYKSEGGTNWEAALQQVSSISNSRSDAEKFIIFVSDGKPTFRSSEYVNNAWDWNGQYKCYGSGNDDNNGWNYGAAKKVATELVKSGYQLYTVNAYGEATNMQNLVSESYKGAGKTSPVDHYFEAKNQSALNEAFENIVQQINHSATYQNVTISDPLTPETGIIPEFTYEVTDNEGKKVNDGLTLTLTDGSNISLPAAQYNESTRTVTWNLGTTYNLPDGYTFKVTFEVFPTQETADKIAGFKNGKTYTSDDNPNIIKENGDYKVYSNTTEAKVTYHVVKDNVAGGELSTSYNRPTMDVNPVLVHLTKNWDDSLDTNVRPDSIEFDVNRDGTVIDRITLSKDNWTRDYYLAAGIVKADGTPRTNGHLYTFEEKLSPEDSKKYEITSASTKPMYVRGALKEAKSGSSYEEFDSNHNVSVGTNTLKGRLEIKKEVEVANGSAPAPANTEFTINVTLNKNGEQIASKFNVYNADGERTVTGSTTNEGVKTITLKANESVVFDNLDTGTTYTVEEVSIPTGFTNRSINYSNNEKVKAITANHKDVVTVVNDYFSITANKVWSDNKNQDGIRTSVTFKLQSTTNGTEWTDVTGSERTIGTTDNSSAAWTGYPAKDADGHLLTYQVVETDIPNGYTSAISGENGNYTITNKHTPEIVDISGTKTWADNNNQDGKRPGSITVKLKDGNDVVATKEVTAANGWTYKFENLPKYREGKVGEEIAYTVTEESVTGYSTSISGYNITNSYTPETVTVSGSKTWIDNNNQDGKRPEKITVKVMDGETVVATKEVTEADNWAYSFENLPKYRYGSEWTEITYTVDEEPVADYEKSITGYNISNTHIPETVTVSGSKNWNDNDNQDGKRPTSIIVNLSDGEKVVDSKEVTAKDGWAYSFTDLPKYKNGTEIPYTVSEAKVPNGYTETKGTKYNGYVITNKHTLEKTEVSGAKTWDDSNNRDGIRPGSITVNLLADGTKVDSKTVTAADDWKYSFADLNKYANGHEIAYTVTEEKVDGYTTTVDGYNITNTHAPEKIDITGSKVWADDNNRDGLRPTEITVNLFANGTKVDEQTVKAGSDGSWTYTFANMPKKASGEDITYTVTEEAVENYTTSYDGFTITNTHVPATTSVTVNKTWNDANNQDGKRPESITVNLLANGKVLKTQKIGPDANGNWSYTFDNLNEYENGQKINYTVTENTVEGYSTVIDGYNITNSYTPETTKISGTKTWDDADNQDGKRPTSITVNLLKNGTKIASRNVSADDNWSYDFGTLPVYEKGQKITYTVIEVPVDGYESSVDGYNVTNRYAPEKTSVNVSKVWEDANNQDGLRKAVTVKLFANDADTGKTVTLSEDNKWQAAFTELDKYSNGEEITYTVEEVEMNGYTPVVTRIENSNNFVITNIHTPATTEISGTKTWDDSDNQDGIRPTQVTINLVGKVNEETVETRTATVNAESNWAYKFDNLPVNKNGSAITYEVSETPVDGYITETDGRNFTNKHTPSKVEKISGTKTWDDNNNQDGQRPESITVRLLANGETAYHYDGTEVAPVTVKADENGNWNFTFTDLPEYKVGTKIVYTVTEDKVDGYDVTYSKDGLNITNIHTPETYTSIFGHKTWVDGNDVDGKRPESITVKLLADGEVVDTRTVAGPDWNFDFGERAKYKGGQLIDYTIAEEAVDGYTTEITGNIADGYTISNTHEPEKIAKISGTKTWNDNNNQDNKRPTSITVRLYADGTEVASTTTDEQHSWYYEFTDLPKYSGGKKITYTVSEDAVEGYEASIDGFNITNTHELETMNISGEKVWDDADNQDGVRPESIIVHLYANGEEERTQTVTAENNWKFSFENLYKYRNGNPIRYSVVEEYVEGYEIGTVTGNAEDGFVITNKRTPEMINRISGTKTWDDNNNQDGKRPESITVRLLADGTEVANQTVTASNDWNYEFTNLPKYRNGKEITYTIAEDDVEGYTVTVEGYNITNTHTPETVRINGQKVWNDNNNAGNTRPESITVQLYANGVQVAETTANKDLEWFFTFGELPVYANGEKITYTVTETPVEGYRSSVSGDALNGFTVRNTLRPQTPETNDKDEPTIKPATPTTTKRRPQTPFTADTSNVALYGGLTFVALATVLGILIRKRES